MGVEIATYGAGFNDMDDVDYTDSELVHYVRDALKSVCLGERDNYNQLIGVMYHRERLAPDEVALLVTSLKGLSGAVSYFDIEHHRALLASIFGMSMWNYGPDVMDALIELIISLAASSGKLVDSCLTMLVDNFSPPPSFIELLKQPRGLARKDQVLSRVHSALRYIAELMPLAPARLLPIIIQKMPNMLFAKEPVILLYVENMLMLEGGEMGEFLGSKMLMAVVDGLIDLDVEIGWDDLLEEYSCRGIFDLELEDMEETADDADRDFNEFPKEGLTCKSLAGNVVADKLDSLMMLTFEHLKSCDSFGRLDKVFEVFLQSFKLTVLKTYKSKFTQFVMFYACSLDPKNCGVKFATLLADIFTSNLDLVTRMSAVAYLASYLSRAKFLSTEMVIDMLKRLVYWCVEYCERFQILSADINPIISHQIFYSGCQAIMYVLCFRMRSCAHILKSELLDPVELILNHSFNPLEVCLPSIVNEFLKQANAVSLFTVAKKFVVGDGLESDHSKVFGGAHRLDMFFPFDPYLLRKSDRFIRPNFVYWSMVTPTYADDDGISDDDTVDEYEDEHVDDEMARSFRDGLDLDGCDISFNKMSITPKPFNNLFGNQLETPLHMMMPSRIRPSMSPESL